MKVRASVRKICKDCKVRIRGKGPGNKPTRFIECKANPRHKQRQG